MGVIGVSTVVYNHWTTGLDLTGLDWTGDIETRVPGSAISFFFIIYFLHTCALCVGVYVCVHMHVHVCCVCVCVCVCMCCVCECMYMHFPVPKP